MSAMSFVMRFCVAGFVATLVTNSVANDAVEFLLPEDNSAFAVVSGEVAKLDSRKLQLWTTKIVSGDAEESERLLRPVEGQRRNAADFIVRLDATRDGLIQGFSIYETENGGLLADQAFSGGQPKLAVNAACQLVCRMLSAYRHPCCIRPIVVGDVELKNSPPAGARLVAVFLELFERRLCDSPQMLVMSRSADFWQPAPVENGRSLPGSLNDAVDLCVSWSDDWSGCEVTALVRDACGVACSIRIDSDELDGVVADQLAKAIWDQRRVARPEPSGNEESVRHLKVAQSLWQRGLKGQALESAELAAMTALADADSVMWLSDRLREQTHGLQRKELQGQDRVVADRLMIRAFQATCDIAKTISVDQRQRLDELQQSHGITLRVRGMTDLLREVQRRVSAEHREYLVARSRAFSQSLVDVARDLTLKALADGDAREIARNAELYCRVLSYSKSDIGNRVRIEPRLGEDAADATLRWLKDMEHVPQGVQPWYWYNVVLGDFTQYGRDDPDTLRVLEVLDQHPEPLVQLSAKRARLMIHWKKKKPEAGTRADQLSEIRDDALAMLDMKSKAGRGTSQSLAVVDFLDRCFNQLVHGGGESMARLMMETAEALMERGMLSFGDERMALDGASAALRHADGETGLETARRVSDFLTDFVTYRQKQAGDGASSDSAIHKADQIRLRLETKWPELSNDATRSAVAVRQLYQAPGASFSQWMIAEPFVKDEVAYAVTISPIGQGSQIQLVAIPLDGEPSFALGAITSTDRYRYQYQLYRNYVTATCTDESACYVSVKGMGIFRFALGTAAVSRILAPGLLPDADVQSLEIADGHLYAGLQSGWLIRAALSAELSDPVQSVETLVSTSRSGIKSPLDSYSAFDVPHLLFDSARKRLLIVIQRSKNDGGQLELWERPLAGEAKLVHALARPQRRQTFARLDRDILTVTDVWIARLNLSTGAADILSNYPLGNLRPTRKLWIPYSSEPVICAGSVWWLQGGTMGRYGFPDGQPKFEKPKEFVKGSPFDSGDRSYLRPVDNNRFLAYYGQRLWLVTPHPPESPAESAP